MTWGNLGAALYYGGKKDEAMQAYRKAAELAGEELQVNPEIPTCSAMQPSTTPCGGHKTGVAFSRKIAAIRTQREGTAL